MDNNIGSRVPMLGLTGLGDFCPVVVTDGDAGSYAGYESTQEDCVDGALLNHGRMRPASYHLPQHLSIGKDISEFDSILSSGFGSMGNDVRYADKLDDVFDQCLPTTVHQTCQDTMTLLMSPQDDEAYGSITSIPPAEEIYMPDCDGDTMLHMAIIQDSAPMAWEFIRAARNINDLAIMNNLGQTPLHLAAYVNMPSVVQLLVQHNVELDTRNRDGNTALHLACREGHMEVVTILLRARAEMASLMNYEGLTCLHLAVKHRHTEVAYELVKSGAVNVNIGDGCSGRTVLHLAVQKGDLELAMLLLTKCGADVNAPARDGLLPITIALGQRNQNVINLLLCRGATLENSPEDDGFCSEDEMEIDTNTLALQHLSLNGDHSEEEDLYS